MKNVLTIQDISCVGKCSATIALPVISAFGVEVSILPTTILSTHTMFQHVHFHDLTTDIEHITQQWEQEDIHFDVIYIGYLGKIEQIEIIKQFICKEKSRGSYIVLDPVMGDHGKLYRGFDKEYVLAMRELSYYADILLPNLTELSLLTDTTYEKLQTENKIFEAVSRLKPNMTIITGMQTDKEKIYVGLFEREKQKLTKYSQRKVNAQYHGTGDLFASTFVGALASGSDIEQAIKLSMNYVGMTIEETAKEGREDKYGVLFEKTIPYLVQKISKI